MERQRLHQLLTDMVEKRLILISAPAGYGKTSLMVDFTNKMNLPVCWYTIDRHDYDPLQFILYLAASIHKKYPAFGAKTLSSLTGNQGKIDMDFIASVVINDIYENITEHFFMVLDDFHLVNDNLEIREFISRLILDLDENCHFIIASRTLLSLSVLPNLIASSLVDGLSYEELEFNPDEIQDLYLQNYQLTIDGAIAQEIQQKTEGWVTGILLTSQVNEEVNSSRLRINRISGFSLEDYFAQITNKLPEHLRLFLLQSSLIEEFNATYCKKVIGPVFSNENAPWQDWMNDVLTRNLFISPVGDDGDWLRYHPLFLEFLQNNMNREFPNESMEILTNLANFSLANKDWDRAFSIFRRLNFQDQLIEMIENYGMELILNGRIATLSAWLDSLSTETLNSRPFIIALQGNVAMILGNTSLSMTLFNQAINSSTLASNLMQYIRILSMRTIGYRFIGKIEQAKNDANEILALVGDNNEYLKMKGEAQRNLGLCNFHQGQLQNACQDLEKALDTMTSINDRKNIAIINLELGLVQENLGNYSQAKDYYLRALEFWKTNNNLIWLSNIHNNLGVLYQMMGEYVQAYEAFEQGLKYARACGYSRMEAFILTGIGDVYAELQVDEQSMQAYYMAEVIADKTQEHFLQVYIKIQKAILMSYSNDFTAAYNLLKQASDLVGLDGSSMEKHLIDLEFAGMKIRQGKINEFLPMLENASRYFEAGGHKVQFERSHLFLALAYIGKRQQEMVIKHLLHIFSCLDDEFPPSSLISSAARFIYLLKKFQADLMQDEFNKFLIKIGQFQEKLPLRRKELRERAQAVPMVSPSILIRSFGRMQVKVNNKVVSSSDWQTQAARDLFYLLLAHPEGMTKEEISLNFWPDANSNDAKFRFKNTIYRLRRAIGKGSVIFDQNLYRFNNNLNYEYDVELFLKENARAIQAKDPLEKLSHFREAIKQYKGIFLSEIDSTWVISPREYLRQTYLNILIQMSTIYFNQSNFDLALDYCQRAIQEDNLLEDAYRLAMKIYAAMGNRAAMALQYQRCVEILDKEINALPSPKTVELYELLIK